MSGKYWILTAAVLVLLLAVQPAAAVDWQIETVQNLVVGGQPSMAITNDGVIAVSYYDMADGSGELRYAYGDVNGWHRSTVDTGGTANVGMNSALALRNGEPCIAYIDTTNSALKYAEYTRSGWAITTLEGPGGFPGTDTVSGCPAILVMPNSDVFITFWDIRNGDLDWCFRNHLTGGWSHGLIDSNIGTAWNEDPAPSLALDYQTGVPGAGVLYTRRIGATENLRYAILRSGGQDVVPSVLLGAGGRGSVASRSVPLQEGDGGWYGYKFWSAATTGDRLWYGLDSQDNDRDQYTVTADAQDSAELHAYYTSIALDRYNMSCIAYTDPTANQLMYAWNDGFWHSGTVAGRYDADGSYSRPTLAIGPSGNPVICYYDANTNEVRVARGSNAVPTIPAKKSYEQYLTFIGNQAGGGGCGFFSYLHSTEILKEMEAPYTPDYSFLFTHYLWRSSMNGTDFGLVDPRVPHIAGGMHDHDALETYGYALETDYPTNFDLLNGGDPLTVLQHPPSPEIYATAANYRIANHSHQFRRPTAKMAERLLAVNGPLVLYQYIKGHVIALIGYDRDQKLFTVVDSDEEWPEPAGVYTISYADFDQRMIENRWNSLVAVKNKPTPLVHPYTARINVTHPKERRFLEVSIGAVGQAPLVVWNLNNRNGDPSIWTDGVKTLEIDVPLPSYAKDHWPPSDQNPWYVQVVDHDPNPGFRVTLNEITFVKRSTSWVGGNYLVDTYQPKQPLTVPYMVPSQGKATVYVPGSPTILGINPSQATMGTFNLPFTITGSHFQTGATVTLSKRTTAPPPFDVINIQASNVQVQGTAGQQTVTGSFDLTTAPAGTYNITVTNPSSVSGSYQDGFTVTGSVVSVGSITPNSGTQGSTVAITNLAGAGFLTGATVKLTRAGSADIAATSVNVVLPTKITCSFALPSTAAIGAWNVVVTNPGAPGATLTGGFTVNAAPVPPTVSSITPNSGTRGSTVAISNLVGTGFLTGATVKLTRAGFADIAATGVSVVSPTKITCSFALPSTAAVGAWNVIVTNTGGQSGGLSSGFTVTVPVTTTVTTTVPTTAITTVTPSPTATLSMKPVPGGSGMPTDTNADTKYDDVNGNSRRDFADVVLYFNQMTWIAANEPVAAFDCNGNGRVDFADVVWLFTHL